MAEHNALTFFPELGKGVVKVLGLGQDETGTTRVSETLYPIANLWDRTQSEWLLPRGERRFGIRGTTPIAPALRFASIQMAIPAGAPIIMVLERLTVNQAVIIEFTGFQLANPVNLTPLCKDSRNSNPGATTTNRNRTTVQYGDVANITNPTLDTLGAADVIAPGYVLASVGSTGSQFGLYITQVAVASQFSFSLEFRERIAKPGELDRG